MDEAGGLLLLLKGVIDKEFQGKISNPEASKKIDIIRKEIESVFYEVEKLNPPSNCSSLKQKILTVLISMQDIVVANSEYLSTAKEGLKEQSADKLIESRTKLEKFRKDFHDLTRMVNILLSEKRKKT